MAANRTTDHNAIVEEFRSKVEELKIYPTHTDGTKGRPFVQVRKLKTWLEESGSPLGSPAQRLLNAAYQNRAKPGTPIRPERLFEDRNPAVIVFSILLLMDRGHLIDLFCKYSLTDPSLTSMTRSGLLEKTRRMRNETNYGNPEDLADEFYYAMLEFCPVLLESDIDLDLDSNFILPICRKTPLRNKGGCAKLYYIDVPDEFVHEQLKDPDNCSTHSRYDDTYGLCHRFVLKVFDRLNKANFTREKEAFDALHDQKGLIRCLGFIVQKEHPEISSDDPLVAPETTYNIILEKAEFNLDEYFRARAPPVLKSEIDNFWNDLFQIADAVRQVHNFTAQSQGVDQEHHGWHADIKPANILYVGSRFKLADPGMAKFERKLGGKGKQKMDGGTQTYGRDTRKKQSTTSANAFPGAPECSSFRRVENEPVHQKIDIWSLGCVFSIAATWVLFGQNGIAAFKRVRIKAFNEVAASSPSTVPVLAGCDCFHDGSKPLLEVRRWHALLHSVIRQSDKLTGKVLDLVDRRMLVEDPETRWSAEVVWRELGQYLRISEQTRSKGLSKTIREALREQDKEAESRPDPTTTTTCTISEAGCDTALDEADALGVKYQGPPLTKVTHRLKALTIDRVLSDSFDVQSPFSSPTSETDNGDYKRLARPSNQETLYPPPVTFQLPPTRPDSQDIFQAQHELELTHRTNQRRSIWKPFHPKSIKLDQLLARHFINRDIHFLVDNAETMCSHWPAVKALLKTLFQKAEGLDKDGMDLEFTFGTEKVVGRKNQKWSELQSALDSDNAQPTKGCRTDMLQAFSRIVDVYVERLKHASGRGQVSHTKSSTLYVLTDGEWKATEKQDLKQYMIEVGRKVQEYTGNNRRRQLSTQFVQFGTSEEARETLQELDTVLATEGIRDFVDHEPFGAYGDLNKIILGSFVEEYDSDEPPFRRSAETTDPFIKRQSHTSLDRHSASSPLSTFQDERSADARIQPFPDNRRKQYHISGSPRSSNSRFVERVSCTKYPPQRSRSRRVPS